MAKASTSGVIQYLLNGGDVVGEVRNGAVETTYLRGVTAYYNRAGDYVVRDDCTGMIIQISKYGDSNWIPDDSIKNPYRGGIK